MQNLSGDILKPFPFLQNADEDILTALRQNATLVRLPAEEYICWEGDRCNHLALLLEGTVRVYKVGENGREITLYRLHSGESCVLTASCILSGRAFPALAVVEKPATALLVPAGLLKEWVSAYPPWREYVFSLMTDRLGQIITTVEEVAFRRVDIRLAELLLKSANVSGTVKLTHQEIARDLGSAREVISRILKDFEKQGWIDLQRGAIVIENKGMLKKRATTG